MKAMQETSSSSNIMMKVVLIIFLLAFGGVLFLQWFKQDKINQYLAHLPPTVYKVTAIQIQPTDWTPTLSSTGLIRPQQGAVLSSQAPGVVKKINVVSGQQVKKGDLLIELDSSVEKAQLQASEAKLPSVKNIYQRYQALYKTKSVSQVELNNATANYQSLVANIEALKASIARRQIYAPFDGIAGIVRVNVGQYVNVGTEMVRIEDHSTMKVTFALSQDELPKLALGQKVLATTDIYPDETFVATVSAIEPAINRNTGLIELEATFDNPENKLLSGMFTRLQVELPTLHNQIVVPQIGITYNMYGQSAYILEPLTEQEKQLFSQQEVNLSRLFKAKQISVETLKRRGTDALLKANKHLTAGSYFLTGGLQNVSNGTYVEVIDKPIIGASVPAETSNY